MFLISGETKSKVLKHCLRDLRNNYWILYDVLNKNWDKIVKPKGDKSMTFSMY